jgi:PEP-CTERM motif
VDAADYVTWRKGGPLQNEVATIGSVTPEDYTAWRARFGNMSGSGSSLAGAAAVPEPNTVLLLAVGMFVLWGVPASKRRFQN